MGAAWIVATNKRSCTFPSLLGKAVERALPGVVIGKEGSMTSR